MKKVFILAGLLSIFISIYLYWIYQTLPDAKKLSQCMTTEMNRVYLCPQSKQYVKLSDISKRLIDAVLISEDYSFYSHNGFDFEEIKNSFMRNITEFHFVRGGSTISQQLTKNVFLTPEKSINRKFTEALLARKIEKLYSKNFILERYLNVIELGKNIYGVKAAARHYFNKLPSQLNVLESAYIAMLLPSPINYSQSYEEGKLTEFGKTSILRVCRKLKNAKKISENEYQNAIKLVDQFPWFGLELKQEEVLDAPDEDQESEESETYSDTVLSTHPIDEPSSETSDEETQDQLEQNQTDSTVDTIPTENTDPSSDESQKSQPLPPETITLPEH